MDWRQECFGRCWSAAQRGMRADSVVVSSSTFDNKLRFARRRKHLAIEQLVLKVQVEALAVAIFPATARLEEQCLYAEPAESVSDCLSRPTQTRILRT